MDDASRTTSANIVADVIPVLTPRSDAPALPNGSNPDELRGCRAILIWMAAGAAIWLGIIGAIVWLAT